MDTTPDAPEVQPVVGETGLKKRFNFSRKQKLIIVAVFAVIGVIAIIASFALTPGNGDFEGETMAVEPLSTPYPTPAPTLTPTPTPSPTPSPTPAVGLAQLLKDDMTKPHEALPHGVPTSYDWEAKPVVQSTDPSRKPYYAYTAWGQLYEVSSGNSQPNARVQIRDITGYVLLKSTGKWTKVQGTTSVGGGEYVEDFVGNKTRPTDFKVLTDGSVSAHAGGGYNFHFWPASGRATINPNDVVGVLATVRARLEPGTYDASKTVGYVLGMGSDWWVDPTAPWSNFNTNAGVAVGRLKRVDANWRLYTVTMLKDSTSNPTPPALNVNADELR